MTREPWHRRSGARLSAGPGAGVRRPDGSREATRPRAIVLECFRCGEAGDVDGERAKLNRIRRLTLVRVVHAGTTMGTTLFCSTCLGGLEPLDPDPLTVAPAG